MTFTVEYTGTINQVQLGIDDSGGYGTRASLSASTPTLDGEPLIANDIKAIMTFPTDKDIQFFQEGDEVQPGIEILETDVAAKTITAKGGDWGAAPNYDEKWSDGITGVSFGDAYPIENAFDGDLSTRSLATQDTNLY